MEVIIFLIIMSIFSALTNKNKRMNQRQGTTQRPGTPMTPRSPLQSRPLQQARPLERPRTQVPENPQGSLGSLIRMLSGEDEAEARRLAREKQDRLYREQAAAEEMRMRREAEENERLDEQRREMEMRDPDEIGDAEDMADSPVDDMGGMVSPMEGISPMWNLSEAKKGIIWREILDGPRSKTRNQPDRRR
jgi:hypothetical protein